MCGCQPTCDGFVIKVLKLHTKIISMMSQMHGENLIKKYS